MLRTPLTDAPGAVQRKFELWTPLITLFPLFIGRLFCGWGISKVRTWHVTRAWKESRCQKTDSHQKTRREEIVSLNRLKNHCSIAIRPQPFSRCIRGPCNDSSTAARFTRFKWANSGAFERR